MGTYLIMMKRKERRAKQVGLTTKRTVKISSCIAIFSLILLACFSKNNTNINESYEKTGYVFSYDSVCVFLSDTLKKCYDCYDFAELYVSIDNNTKTDIEVYFNKTKDSIRFEPTFSLVDGEVSYELNSNDAKPIRIKKKSKLNITLGLEAQTLRLSQKNNITYRNLIYKIIQGYSVFYKPHLGVIKFTPAPLDFVCELVWG